VLALLIAGLAPAGAAPPAPAEGVRPAALAAHNQKAKNKPAPAAAPASVLVEERGKFRVLVDGKAAGSEEFDIRPSGGRWIVHGNAEVSSGEGGTAKVTGKLELAPDGAPLRYEWTASAPKKAGATIVFEGSVAKMELRLEGAAPYSQEFSFESPHVLILDNNMYDHYAILARLYDWERKEPKTYSVLIPQDLTPGTVLVEYGGAQVVEGQKFELLRVRSTDLEIQLYCDNGRLMRIEVPASKAVVIREAAAK
jgi:hypothetical protein